MAIGSRMVIVGRTVDCKDVVGSIFHLVDTHGIPLDLIVEELKRFGAVPAWDDYVAQAREAGWLDWTIYKSLTEQGLEVAAIRAVMRKSAVQSSGARGHVLI